MAEHKELIAELRLQATHQEGRMNLSFAALLTQAADALEESAREWRPIESAPRDGTGFLAWWGGDTKCDIRSFGVTQFLDFEYRSVDDYEIAYGEPTHWMPLPPAPNSQKDS